MIGDRLKSLRIRSKKSQKEMGEFLGITRQGYSKYVRGESEPDINTLNTLAEYFDVTVDYLTGKSIQQQTLTEKDRKDIAKRMEKITEDLCKNEGLSFFGEPISDEVKESLIDAIKHIVTDAQIKNKKYIPKKYRK